MARACTRRAREGAQLTAQSPAGRSASSSASAPRLIPSPSGRATARSRVCRRASAGAAARSRLRARILAEQPSEAELDRLGQFLQLITTRWDRIFVDGRSARLRAGAGGEHRALLPRAATARPQEVAYDYLTEGEDQFLFFPVVGYVLAITSTIREMLDDPARCLASATAARIAA